MEKIFNTISIAGAIIGGALVSVFGNWDVALWALLVFMVLDYITGIIKAVYNKQLSSEIGYKGLLRKIVILIVVAVSNVVQTLIGVEAIREMVIMFYIANEGISILENATEILPFMPDKLKDILLQLRNTDNKNID